MKPKYYECDICGHNHPWDFNGDCRDDSNRFTDEALDAKHGAHGYELVPMSDRLEADDAVNDRAGKSWSVADTEDTYIDASGAKRYRVKARFDTESEAVAWLATQDAEKVKRGDFEICGPPDDAATDRATDSRFVQWHLEPTGYRVVAYDGESQPIDEYSAGNHPLDSQAVARNDRAVPRATLEKWAQQTAEETADRLGIARSRISRDTDSETDAFSEIAKQSPDATVTKKISELIPGDLVDLENDKYADPKGNPLLECEYVTVDSIERESPECIAVYFRGFDMVGFPPDHVVKVGGHDKEYDE